MLDCEHYSVALRPTAVFATSYFCNHCSLAYTARLGHRNCVVKCNSCLYSPPCQNLLDITCSDCNRTFMNPKCYQNHKRINICSKLKLCSNCFVCYTMKKKSVHMCGESYCSACKCLMPIRHKCYMPIKNVKKETKNGILFVFYDFESYQNKQFGHNDKKFEDEVMLCFAQQACKECYDNDIELSAPCGVREHIFIRKNVIKNFMRYLGENFINFFSVDLRNFQLCFLLNSTQKAIIRIFSTLPKFSTMSVNYRVLNISILVIWKMHNVNFFQSGIREKKVSINRSTTKMFLCSM